MQPPTLSDVSTNIATQLAAQPRSFEAVLSKVLAGVVISLYKYGGFILLQRFVATATYDAVDINGKTVRPLKLWGDLYNVPSKDNPTHAELVVQLPVITQGGTLPAGSAFVGPGTGITYVSVADVALDAATKQVTIRAASDQGGGSGAGTIGNLVAGQTVGLVNAPASVSAEASVLSQAVTASDGESVEDYRARIATAVATPPQGGAYSDYRLWGSSVPGVKTVYPYTGTTAGTVDVYVESSTETDGIPTGAQLTAVGDAIELDESGLATRRPVGALVNVLPIVRPGWKAIVTGLVTNSLTEGQTLVTTALEDYFLDKRPYILGLDLPPRRDVVTRSGAIGAVEDVVTALGGTFTTVTIERISEPGVSVESEVLAKGELAKLTTIEYA